jgi:hypothetical protein
VDENQWIGSGFFGWSFGQAGDSLLIQDDANAVAFGGQLAYLWRGIVGGEFLAEFTPSFDALPVNVDNPRVNTYMANAIGAYPFRDGTILPYASGGFGGVQMNAEVFDDLGTGSRDSEMRWGTNIGFGAMAFPQGRIGFRGDVRYYKASTNDTLDPEAGLNSNIVQELVSGVHFWRTTAGISFRW